MSDQNGRLTDRKFWVDYWSTFKAVPLPSGFFFTDLLSRFPKSSATKPCRFIEIGGYPGNFSAYFQKTMGYQVTMLDYVVVPEPIRQVEQVNHLPANSISSIEGDFFSYRDAEQTEKFDVVFSAGFIEHFEDTEKVVAQHLVFLKKGGTLFISLPNFRGLNGWIQKTFDPKNYAVHNIQSMDISRLKGICKNLGLNDVDVFYHGTPCFWLDHPELLPKFLVRLIYLLSSLISRIPGRNRWLSPHIVIMAKA